MVSGLKVAHWRVQRQNSVVYCMLAAFLCWSAYRRQWLCAHNGGEIDKEVWGGHIHGKHMMVIKNLLAVWFWMSWPTHFNMNEMYNIWYLIFNLYIKLL